MAQVSSRRNHDLTELTSSKPSDFSTVKAPRPRVRVGRPKPQDRSCAFELSNFLCRIGKSSRGAPVKTVKSKKQSKKTTPFPGRVTKKTVNQKK